MNPIALHTRRWERVHRRLILVAGRRREAELKREAGIHRRALLAEIRRALKALPGFRRSERAALYARLRRIFRQEKPETPEKSCRGCGESWPLAEDFWHRMSRSADGFRSRCIACTVASHAASGVQP